MPILGLFLGLSLLNATPADQFVFNNGAEPEVLDPQRMTATTDSALVLQMFEGLIGRDSTYMKREPALASKWDLSKDRLTYTFTIPKGKKWSNGDPITIEQVRDSLLRALSPEVACPYIQNYTDNIEGAAEYVKNYSSPDRKTYEAKLGIRIKNPDKLEIKLRKPNNVFLDYLTQPQFFVVHPSMIKPDSKAWNQPDQFITNGPYRLKQWEVNKQIVLEKNKNYWGAEKVKIPLIVAIPVNDQATSYNLFRSKQIDWTGDNSINSTLVSSLRADPEFSVIPKLGTYTYIFNTKKKPFDNVKVRKALSLAIHRAEITDKVLKGGQVPTNRFVPPGIEGYKPPIVPPLPFEKQIEMAKTLLAEAGYPGGKGFPETTIVYNTAEGHQKIAQAVQQMWKKYLGINIGLENKEWKIFLEEQQRRIHDISRQSWIGDLPDAGNMMDLFMTDGANNHTNWGNKDFDRIILASYSMTDAKKRNEELAKAEKILLDEVPFIPIYHYVQYGLMSSRIAGFKPNMFGRHQFKYFTKK